MSTDWEVDDMDCPHCGKEIDGGFLSEGLDSESSHATLTVTCDACGCVFKADASISGTIEVSWRIGEIVSCPEGEDGEEPEEDRAADRQRRFHDHLRLAGVEPLLADAFHSEIAC